MLIVVSEQVHTEIKTIGQEDHEALLIIVREAISDFKFIEREVPKSNFQASIMGLEHVLKELTI